MRLSIQYTHTKNNVFYTVRLIVPKLLSFLHLCIGCITQPFLCFYVIVCKINIMTVVDIFNPLPPPLPVSPLTCRWHSMADVGDTEIVGYGV